MEQPVESTDNGELTREEVIDILKEFDEVIVRFIKMNGETRVMKCTLVEDQIPDSYTKASGGGNDRPGMHGPIPVYDLENNGWRSFHLRSIVDMSVANTPAPYVWKGRGVNAAESN